MVKKLKYQLTLPITAKNPKYIGFALDVFLKPSVLSSGLLPVRMNNLLMLNKSLLFLFQMHRGDLCLPLKKKKEDAIVQLQLIQNQHFSNSTRIIQIKNINSTHL